MSETGNEHFTHAINKVKETCGPEIKINENFLDVDGVSKTAKQALDNASSFFNNRTDAAASVLEARIKLGESACGGIAEALYNTRASGEFKIPESSTPPKRIVAKNIDTHAPNIQRNPGI